MGIVATCFAISEKNNFGKNDMKQRENITVVSRDVWLIRDKKVESLEKLLF